MDGYAAQEGTNDSKLLIFAMKHKADTYCEHLTHSKTVSAFKVDPHSNI